MIPHNKNKSSIKCSISIYKYILHKFEYLKTQEMTFIIIDQIFMNKILLSVVLSVIVAIAGVLYTATPSNDQQTLFNQWKNKIGAKFDEKQNLYRFNVFQENVAKINAHNSRLGRGHEQELNEFAFLTHDQFVAQYLSPMETPTKTIEVEETPINGPTVDWVSYGAVSPVKSQGSCTATYAFSAVGAIEGVSVIFYKTQQEYSVQQVIDCSQQYGNNGCVNGRMDFTFTYVKDKGINTWAAYPYVGSQTTCRSASGLFKINGYANITDCVALANALTVRPISVAVDGNNFQFYKSGIFYNCATNLSLAALLVGMNDSSWNVKLSWGTTWGESGYIRLARGNTCGICQVASYPTV